MLQQQIARAMSGIIRGASRIAGAITGTSGSSFSRRVSFAGVSQVE